jgi:hypothetical protein
MPPTSNYNTLEITTAHAFRSVYVFTSPCWVAVSNNEDSSASVLTVNHQLRLLNN